MKKEIVLFAITIVASIAMISPLANSEETEKTTIAEYCASHNDLGLSHGACVAYFTNNNVAPHDASVCRNAGIQNLLGVTNHGQCMKKLAQMRK